jgi:nitroreductase
VDIHAALRARRTVHSYAPGRVLPEGALERALEAAHLAPNHRFTYPWRFTLPGPVTRAGLADLAVAVKERKRPLNEGAREQVRAKVLDPSAVVVLSQRLDPDPHVREEDYAAVACAVQNAMLSLWSEGVGSKWSTGAVTTDERTYRTLEISPDTEQIVGFLWVGLASREQPPKARRRRALSDVLRHLP